MHLWRGFRPSGSGAATLRAIDRRPGLGGPSARAAFGDGLILAASHRCRPAAPRGPPGVSRAPATLLLSHQPQPTATLLSRCVPVAEHGTSDSGHARAARHRGSDGAGRFAGGADHPSGRSGQVGWLGPTRRSHSRRDRLRLASAQAWANCEPDIIGSAAVGHEGGAYTMAIYFTTGSWSRAAVVAGTATWSPIRPRSEGVATLPHAACCGGAGIGGRVRATSSVAADEPIVGIAHPAPWGAGPARRWLRHPSCWRSRR
jgi:hypothetical protein